MILVENWTISEVAIYLDLDPASVQRLVGLAKAQGVDLADPIDSVRHDAPATH